MKDIDFLEMVEYLASKPREQRIAFASQIMRALYAAGAFEHENLATVQAQANENVKH